MLRIRFSRTGKTGQPSFRIVVTNRRSAVKSRYVEMLGHYIPTRKIAVINKERVTYWISKGAIPTDSAASLFKKQGMTGMEVYMEPRDKKHKSKGEKAPAEAKPTAPKQEEKAVEKFTPEPAAVAAK